jgi:uncharacterized coiled-coil protein SlyX
MIKLNGDCNEQMKYSNDRKMKDFEEFCKSENIYYKYNKSNKNRYLDKDTNKAFYIYNNLFKEYSESQSRIKELEQQLTFTNKEVEAFDKDLTDANNKIVRLKKKIKSVFIAKNLIHLGALQGKRIDEHPPPI